MSWTTSSAHALGEHYRDLCADADACACCAVWQRPGESRAVWLARVGVFYRREARAACLAKKGAA